MNLFYRIGYYLVGLAMGLVIVSFVFSGKRTSCNYGPQARVLATLTTKKVRFSDTFLQQNPTVDSLQYITLLRHARVDFSKNTRGLDSCKVYTLEVGKIAAPNLLRVENCADYVKLLSLD